MQVGELFHLPPLLYKLARVRFLPVPAGKPKDLFKVDTLESPISDLRGPLRERESIFSSTSNIPSSVGGDNLSPLFTDGVVGPRRLPYPAGMDWRCHPSRHPQNRYLY